MRPLLLLLLAFPASAQHRVASVRDARTGRAVEAVDGQVLVRFRRGVAAASAASAAGVPDARPAGGLLGWTLLELPPGVTVEQALARFRGRAEVEAAVPNRVYRPVRLPNDPSLGAQYGLSSISAAAAWEFEVGESTKVTVAVLDSGIDGAHSELSTPTAAMGAFHRRFDCQTGAATPEAVPTDFLGHGSNVAGIIAAETDDSELIAGVSWKAQLLSLRLFHAGCPLGFDSTSDLTVASAILYAVQVATANPSAAGRMLLNISLGGDDSSNGFDGCDGAVQSAAAAAEAEGVPIVAAAGNLHPTSNPNKGVLCPARISTVVSVAATDSQDQLASFSGVGPANWVAAPGVNVLTTRRLSDGGGLMQNSGTSFSSPHAAGLAALVLAAAPSLTPLQLRELLRDTADDLGPAGLDAGFGYGRLNAFRALRRAVKGPADSFAGDQRPIAFPNPAPGGHATFALPDSLQGSGLKIRIFSVAGELVRTLTGLQWDGRNDSGREVASGVYIYLVETERGRGTGKLAVTR